MTDKEAETKPSKKMTESDVLWAQLKDKRITLFGMSNILLSSQVELASSTPDTLYLRAKNPVLIQTIDSLLNTTPTEFGAENRQDRYEVEPTKNGLIAIKRISA